MLFFWHSPSTKDKIILEDKVILMVNVNYSCIDWNSLTGQMPGGIFVEVVQNCFLTQYDY